MFTWTNKAKNKERKGKREDLKLPNLSKVLNTNLYTTKYRQNKDQKLSKHTQFQNNQNFFTNSPQK